jgi:asparagine synthase (glutamine-hydrolysing)
MTAIAAVVSADGRNADDEVRRMLDAAAHRGAEPPAIWRSAGAAIGYRASRSRRGVPDRPFAELAGRAAIVFDGRLDNRDDLERALGAAPGVSDAELTLAAYAKWAHRAPGCLVGDFAFVIWDVAERTLVCARDAMGQRSLFYGSVPGGTVVGSEPQQVLAHPRFAAAVNEGAVAEYLTRTPASVEETVWTGVTRLPPAHTLVVSNAGVRRWRYWDLDPDARIECARDEEYADRFLELFRTAIACRTRGAASVGVFLSGGLDSSAVAGVAQVLALERGELPPRAYSLLFPGLAADETAYIDAVVDKWSLPSVRLDAHAATREEMEREVARYRDLPMYPNGTVVQPLGRRAAAEVDVALTGLGGDEWFGGSLLHTTDLLREGRVFAAFRQFRDDVALPGRELRHADLLRIVVSPLLPGVVRNVVRPVAGGRRPTHDWIRPEFARRVGLRDRLRPRPHGVWRTYAQRDIHFFVNHPLQMIGDEMEDRAAAAAGLNQSHPLHDRRLAEFGFALPESQRWAGGEIKVVMRRALTSVLPPTVLHRHDKAQFSSTFVEALESLGGRSFFARLLSDEAGWIDGAATQRMYDQMIGLYSGGSGSYIGLASALWNVAAVELLLKHEQKERRP